MLKQLQVKTAMFKLEVKLQNLCMNTKYQSGHHCKRLTVPGHSSSAPMAEAAMIRTYADNTFNMRIFTMILYLARIHMQFPSINGGLLLL